MANSKIRSGIGRNSAKHIEWSKLVKERDEWKCKKCGKTENLHSHHIIPWNESIEKRFDLDNGITLCKSCHKIEDGCVPAGWNKGKTHSEETRKKLSESLKGRKVWNKGIKGLVVSPETQFKKGQIPWNKNKPYDLPSHRECKECKISKKITDFTPLQKGRLYSHKCKICRNKLLKERRNGTSN